MLHDLTVISSKKTDLILTVLVDRFLSIHIAEMQYSPRDQQLLVSRGVRSQISSKRLKQYRRREAETTIYLATIRAVRAVLHEQYGSDSVCIAKC